MDNNVCYTNLYTAHQLRQSIDINQPQMTNFMSIILTVENINPEAVDQRVALQETFKLKIWCLSKGLEN